MSVDHGAGDRGGESVTDRPGASFSQQPFEQCHVGWCEQHAVAVQQLGARNASIVDGFGPESFDDLGEVVVVEVRMLPAERLDSGTDRRHGCAEVVDVALQVGAIELRPGGVRRGSELAVDRSNGLLRIDAQPWITIIRRSVISCTANGGPSRVLPESRTPP